MSTQQNAGEQKAQWPVVKPGTDEPVPQQPEGPEQKLKSERVQEPVATFRTQLKSERVQDGLVAAGEAEAAIASIELAIYQPQTVTIELFASKVAITLSGNPAGSNSGGGAAGGAGDSGNSGRSGSTAA